MYSYVSPVAGCGSDVPFIEMMWQGQFSYDLAVELIYLPVSWFNGHFPPIQSHDFIFYSVTSLCRRNTVCFDFGKKDS